jgi:hypothetical protein
VLIRPPFHLPPPPPTHTHTPPPDPPLHPPPHNTQTHTQNARRDKLRRVQGVEIGDLTTFHHELLSTASVKVGCFGNLSKESAMGVAESVDRILKRNPKFSLTRTPSVQPITRIAMLEKGA